MKNTKACFMFILKFIGYVLLTALFFLIAIYLYHQIPTLGAIADAILEELPGVTLK